MTETKGSYKKYLKFFRSLFLFVLLFLSFYYLIFKLDNELKIKEVVLISSDGKSIPVKGVESYLGKRTFLIKSEEVAKHVSKANVELSVQNVELKYPSKIFIYFTKTTPTVWLQVEEGFFKLNENGKIIGKSRGKESDNLPIIKYFRPISYFYLQVGEQIGFNDILSTVELIKLSRLLKTPETTIEIDSKGDVKFQTESGEFFFSSKKDLSLQVYQLEEAIKYLTREGKNFAILDFRFEKTVVGL